MNKSIMFLTITMISISMRPLYGMLVLAQRAVRPIKMVNMQRNFKSDTKIKIEKIDEIEIAQLPAKIKNLKQKYPYLSKLGKDSRLLSVKDNNRPVSLDCNVLVLEDRLKKVRENGEKEFVSRTDWFANMMQDHRHMSVRNMREHFPFLLTAGAWISVGGVLASLFYQFPEEFLGGFASAMISGMACPTFPCGAPLIFFYACIREPQSRVMIAEILHDKPEEEIKLEVAQFYKLADELYLDWQKEHQEKPKSFFDAQSMKKGMAESLRKIAQKIE